MGGGGVGVQVVVVAALHASLSGTLVPHDPQRPGRIVAEGLPAGGAGVPAHLGVDVGGHCCIEPKGADGAD
jgi:hypothetical protein